MLGPQRLCVPGQPDSDHASQRRRSAFEHMVIAPPSPILRYHYTMRNRCLFILPASIFFLWWLYEETYRGHMVNIRRFRAFIFCVMLCVITLILQGNSCCSSDSHTDGIIGSTVPWALSPFWSPRPPERSSVLGAPLFVPGRPWALGFPWPFRALPGPSLVPPWVLPGLSRGEVRGVRFCGVRCEE